MGNITMGQQELKTYGLGMDVIKGKLAIVDYALQIGKSYRQAERICFETSTKTSISLT